MTNPEPVRHKHKTTACNRCKGLYNRGWVAGYKQGKIAGRRDLQVDIKEALDIQNRGYHGPTT